jgi:OmpA family/K319L-like, PKD domain
MFNRFAALVAVLPLVAVGVCAQGLDTKASKDDWEEINFEFNSSVLVDGYPSLLRVAELLQKHPGYKVRVEGHTDIIGGGPYNEKLGQARADSVRDFLVKYGASAGQITTGTRGKVDPKYPGQKPTFTKTDEARWMNRRVVLTVMDESGRMIGAGGPGDAIRAMEPPKGMTDCCTEVLKRLDKLDDIARLLKDLADQNAQLKRDLDALKNNQAVLESKVNQPPPAPVSAPAPVVKVKESEKFQLLGINVGADQDGHVSASGKGRFFGVFGEHYALQAQGEYMYTRGDKEGQFDIGLVDRVTPHIQAGLFASFKSVSLAGDSPGTLGQAAFTVDYIFKWGKLGVFGTKGFMDNRQIYYAAYVNPTTGYISSDLYTQRILKIVDQAGVSGTIGLVGNTYLEGNIAYLKSVVNGDRMGGTLRFVFPINPKFAFTVEGGVNETLLGKGQSGRAVAGVQMGNLMRPKEFMESGIPIPMDVPRVRYEVLTRLVHVGETPPVCDAGPDQIGVPAGTISLNGSATYSADGFPLTYKWLQEAGPSVALATSGAAITTFTAASGQTYTFRLTAVDPYGGQCSARTHVTTTSSAVPIIASFAANPPSITAGQQSTLTWKVTGATAVTISSIGSVDPSGGSNPVSPTATTTYTLTATNAAGSASANATVTVTTPTASLLACFASPANIILGESATLNWQSQNATSVTINNGVGSVGMSGSAAVTPTASTTYTVTATNGTNNTSSTCSIAVAVTAGPLPKIIQFSAAPMSILSGQSSTLLWVVDNATSQTITPGPGSVPAAGTISVSPTATTTYTLTATNAAGSVTATATVTVTQIPNPIIVSFTANPNPSNTPGGAVVLNCQTQNAASITMAGLTFLTPNITYTVYPQATTTYMCIATGENGVTAQKSVTVTVGSTTPPTGQPPTIVIAGGSSQTTTVRNVLIDASGSSSPSGNTPLTYSLATLYGSATIINGNTSRPTVTLGPTPGPYYFNLTVTDSKGMSTTQEITITYAP